MKKYQSDASFANSLKSRKSLYRLSLLGLAAVLISAQPASAADGTWNGTTSADYGVGSNWSAGVVPSPAGTATFNNAGNGNTTITNTTSTLNIIKFDTALAAAYTLGTSSETFTIDNNFAGGTITATATNASNQIINSNLILGNVTGATPGAAGAFTFSNLAAVSGPTLTLNGNITGLSTGTAGAVLINLGGPGTGLVNGNISNGGATTLGLSVNTGTWTLAGNSSYTGPTLTQDAVPYSRNVLLTGASTVLNIGSTNALGASSGVLNITNSTATVQASGGNQTIANTIVLGNNGMVAAGSNSLVTTGKLVLGGTANITNNISGSGKVFGVGDVEIRNATTGTRTVTFNGTGTTVVSGQIVDHAAAITSTSVGSVAVTTGVLKTTGNNTYSGTTVVNGGGTMLINGTHTNTTVAAYTIGNGSAGTLGGTGSITTSGTNRVTIGTLGTIAAGDSTLAAASQTGSLDVSLLTFTAGGATAAFQLGGATVGDGAGNYDQINVTGTANGALVVNTGSILTLSLVNNYVPLTSNVYYILTRADSTAFGANIFSGLTEGSTVTFADGITTGKITYLANWTGSQGSSTLTGGNDLAIYNVIAVPEPSTYALLIGGISFLFVLRRKHKKIA